VKDDKLQRCYSDLVMVREDSTGLVETLRPLWLYTRAEDLLHRGWTGCLQSFQHKPEEKKREGKVTETVPFCGGHTSRVLLD